MRESHTAKSCEKARILVADDQEAVRQMVSRMLRDNGFEVLLPPNSPSAAEMLRDPNLQIDLLITDVMMPEISGPELAQILHHERPGVPLLFISGYVENVVEMDRGGQTAFLSKPFTTTELIRQVRSLLNARDPSHCD
jgi:CheY-like chemotaxis protein